jgi:hypothetical protein
VARGIGKVVQERRTSSRHKNNSEQHLPVTTYLPYVEVVSDHTLNFVDVRLDEERVVMFLKVSVFCLSKQ